MREEVEIMETWRGHDLSEGITPVQLGQWLPWGKIRVHKFSKEAGTLEFDDLKSPKL